MGLFKARDGGPQVDRRLGVRSRADCAAVLRMTSGDRPCRLSDISEQGARLLVANPPRTGIPALLKWGAHEHFCKVVWTNENSCGLTFDRPIPRAVVLETTGQGDEGHRPALDPGRIPLGARRSRRVASE